MNTVENRHYWHQEDIFMSEGEQWFVHNYPDREVDDEHFLCKFIGRTKDRDFLFEPLESSVKAVHSQFRIEHEQMPSMVFRLI